MTVDQSIACQNYADSLSLSDIGFVYKQEHNHDTLGVLSVEYEYEHKLSLGLVHILILNYTAKPIFSFTIGIVYNGVIWKTESNSDHKAVRIEVFRYLDKIGVPGATKLLRKYKIDNLTR